MDKPHRGAPPGNRHHWKGGRSREFHQRVNPAIYARHSLYLKSRGMTYGDWLEQKMCDDLGITLQKEQPQG